MKLSEATYTAFDFETTGLFPNYGDKICEIGAIRVEPDGTTREFNALVNPMRPLSDGAFRVNGITSEMLGDKPVISEVLPSFLEFIEGSVLVAYNAGFDMGFLVAELGDKKEMVLGYQVIDALTLARRCFGFTGGYSLGKVTGHLGIKTGVEHRAIEDARAALAVFMREISILEDEGVTLVEEISSVYREKIPRTRPGRDRVPGASRMEEALTTAIETKSRLKIKYRSVWNGEVTERTITPISIRDGYVYSYCHMRSEYRKFHLDKIEEINK
ncbi:MAG: WYL domain-containing protein [Candidatus Omnitrophica bacterium]|nr:WYL domain-containing protein [Candidatus Omnitrophota bacterium]